MAPKVSVSITSLLSLALLCTLPVASFASKSGSDTKSSHVSKKYSHEDFLEVRGGHESKKTADDKQLAKSERSKSSKSSKAEKSEKLEKSEKSQKSSKSDKSDKDAPKKIRRGNAPCLSWNDSEIPTKAVILCVHGLGLHNATYDAFGQRLSKLGYAVYAIDVRGFGSWMEAKGREKVDFDGCMEDIRVTLKVLHRAHRGLPVFILGESMGGAIALRACALYPELVDGLISSVPAADRFKQGQTKLNVAFHLLADADAPFDIGSQVIKQATNKQSLRESWGQNPLTRLKVSANELIQFQHFMNQNHKWAALIKDRPVLFVQGTDDKLVRPQGTVELYNKLSTQDRQIELIPNGEHLIFEEAQFTDREVEILDKWMSAHLTIKEIPAQQAQSAPTAENSEKQATQVK